MQRRCAGLGLCAVLASATSACGGGGDSSSSEGDTGSADGGEVGDGNGDTADDEDGDDGAGDGDGSGEDDGGVDEGGCKRGVAYGYHSIADLEALSPGVSWWYNWAARPDDGTDPGYVDLGFEYVPQVWGGSFDDDAISSSIRDDATALLGFNEPNFFEQANLSAQQAADLWPRVEAIAATRELTLVSPAVNFCGGGCWNEDPFDYLDAFFEACEGCRVDAIGAHWYACDGPALEWYLGELARYGKPIWLTEFSCGDGADLSLEVQKAYMQEALAILENDANVARYAWFAGRTDVIPNVDLLGPDGQLTELGEIYVSAPAACD